jgi:protein-S-isoprenylcysteine O-methyltransferase Ste14
MDTNSYVTFLVVGVVLVAIDGLIIYRSGRAYLDPVYRDPRAAKSMVQLVTVLFHLVVLGVLALISTLTINTGNPVSTVVVKLGVVLLVLAAVHAATMMILGNIRDRRRDEKVTDELVEQRNHRPTVAPVGDESVDRRPTVSPSIDELGPYSSAG